MELENLLENRTDNSCLQMPYPQHINNILIKATGRTTIFSLFVPHTSIVRILEAVRTIILNWTLKLEEQGILGEGLTFTQEEKSKVAGQSYNVSNFYGPVHGAQIQQDSSHSIQFSQKVDFNIPNIAEFIQVLTKSVHELGLEEKSKEELEADIATLRAQVESPNPKNGIINECLSSVRKILEGAGGALAAKLLEYLASL